MLSGINYDTGFVHQGVSTHEPFDTVAVAADLRVIATELGATAVRLTGGDADRLQVAAELASEAGLEVWWCPFVCDLTPNEARALIVECAERAERLRRQGARVTFLTGAELSLFVHGFLPGESFTDRARFLVEGGAERGPAFARLPAAFNAFLAALAADCRRAFGGPLGYCSLPFEAVDWAPFDLVATDAGYRSGETDDEVRDSLTALRHDGKPIAITEFGCCTYRGAAARGGHGTEIITWDGPVPLRIDTPPVRDEDEQATYLLDQLRLFVDAGVDATFVYTYANFHLPRDDDDPHHDFDLASAGVTAVLQDAARTRLPKHAFRAFARFNADNAQA